MARWASRQPLKVPIKQNPDDIARAKKAALTGTDVPSPYKPGVFLIHQGEEVPEELLTENFLGGALNQLTGLSAADKKKYEAWKRRQKPAIADRWKHLEENPQASQSLFADERPISRVGTKE